MGLSPAHALMAAGAVIAVGLIATLATGDRAAAVGRSVGAAVDGQLAAMGFRLNALHIQGASPMAAADILDAAGVREGQPLLGVDLDALRKRVEQVVWVKDVRVVRLLPDTLILAVVERNQLAVWQNAGRTYVVDDKGAIIRGADPSRFPRLPLIVGAGANEHAAEILPTLASRPRLTARLEALVRVDDRRWDLRLKDGSLVQLPAVGEEQALIQLEQLDQRTRILELGFARIDLRNPDMVAVRPRDAALPGRMVSDGV